MTVFGSKIYILLAVLIELISLTLLTLTIDIFFKRIIYSFKKRAPVAQWVVHLTHTWLVPGSKHAWYKNPIIFASLTD